MTLQNAFEFFAERGAVKWGHHQHSQVHQYTGAVHYTDYKPLAYFFDEQGREIGYWSICNDLFNTDPTVFAPNYRQWDQTFLDSINMRPMPSSASERLAYV